MEDDVGMKSRSSDRRNVTNKRFDAGPPGAGVEENWDEEDWDKPKKKKDSSKNWEDEDWEKTQKQSKEDNWEAPTTRKIFI